MKKVVKVYLASDHAGFKMKENLKKYLHNKRMYYNDLGAYKYKENDDYPDYAFKLAERVAKNGNTRGILICGSGEGMIIAANKVKGIRAVEGYDNYSAKMSRRDNNANILGLRARNFPFSKTKKIIDIWLRTDFSKEKRHKRRIRKIRNYENK